MAWIGQSRHVEPMNTFTYVVRQPIISNAIIVLLRDWRVSEGLTTDKRFTYVARRNLIASVRMRMCLCLSVLTAEVCIVGREMLWRRSAHAGKVDVDKAHAVCKVATNAALEWVEAVRHGRRQKQA